MRIDLNVQCFGAIARTIAEKDKPLVIIGDGDSVPDASAAGGSEPRMVVRESDLAMIREQLRSAARAESSDASHDMLLSQAVSNHPPVDLEGVLEGMATDELSMFVGGGVELQARAAALSRTTRVAACSLLALVGRTRPPPHLTCGATTTMIYNTHMSNEILLLVLCSSCAFPVLSILVS